MSDQIQPPAEQQPVQPAREPAPTDLIVQPAVGYRGRILRPRGLLSESSPLRMRTSEPLPTTGPPMSVLAVVALVLAFLIPLFGAILGHVALSRIKTLGQSGRGLAIAAIILGYAFTVLIVLLIVGIELLMGGAGGSFSYNISS